MKIIETNNAPAAIGSYSQAVQVDNIIYCSGQIGLDPDSMTLVANDFKQQLQQIFINLTAVAKAAGGDLSDIVKLTVYLTDFANYALLNDMMADYFTQPYPARAAVEVAALPKQALVEIDAIMALS